MGVGGHQVPKFEIKGFLTGVLLTLSIAVIAGSFTYEQKDEIKQLIQDVVERCDIDGRRIQC
jgi:hypothetical protein